MAVQTYMITTAPDAIILGNAAQGDMIGKVKSLGPDKFEFNKYDPVARKHVVFKEAKIK